MPDNVLHDLEVKTIEVLLPKLGCNRNAPRQAVCGNSNFAGIELQKLALEKGIGQLRHFFMSLQTEGFPENLAEIAVSWAQLLARTSTPVVTDQQALPQLSVIKWLPEIRKFVQRIERGLELGGEFMPDLQRAGDEFSMDVALQDFDLNKIELTNACRLCKGATLLSDVTTLDGSAIRRDIIGGAKPMDDHKGLMPHQEKPNETSWTPRKRLLNTFADCARNFLHCPLGDWLQAGEQLHRK